MEDFWKPIIYLGLALLYFLFRSFGSSKDDKPQTSTRPARNREEKPKRHAQPQSPASIGELVRSLEAKSAPPRPMLQDKVRQSYSKADNRTEAQSLEGESYEEESYEGQSLETAAQGGSMDTAYPRYRNEASEVNYEVPEKATYAGLNDSQQDRFKEFKIQQKKPNHYAQLFRNPQSVRDAFVMSELLKRKF